MRRGIEALFCWVTSVCVILKGIRERMTTSPGAPASVTETGRRTERLGGILFRAPTGSLCDRADVIAWPTTGIGGLAFLPGHGTGFRIAETFSPMRGSLRGRSEFVQPAN
jgi:hypothetical protein